MQKLIATSFALALLVGLAPHASATATAAYIGASPGLLGVNCGECGPNGENFGGASFAANGLEPVAASAIDASGTQIYISVCQDTDGDSLCGEAADETTGQPAEPAADGCGSVTLTGFDPTMETDVFIYSTGVTANGDLCSGLATSGTIAVDYA